MHDKHSHGVLIVVLITKARPRGCDARESQSRRPQKAEIAATVTEEKDRGDEGAGVTWERSGEFCVLRDESVRETVPYMARSASNSDDRNISFSTTRHS